MKSNSSLLTRVNKPEFFSLFYRDNEVICLDKKENRVTIDCCGYITRSTADAIRIGLNEINCFDIEVKHRPSLNQIEIQKKDSKDIITVLDNEYECAIIDYQFLQD